MEDIHEIFFNGNGTTIEIEEDSYLPEKIVIRPNATVTIKTPKFITSKEFVVATNSTFFTDELVTKGTIVELNGKMIIQKNITFDKETHLRMGPNALMKTVVGDVKVNGNSTVTGNVYCEFEIGNNFVVNDDSKVYFSKKNIFKANYQLILNDNAVMIFGVNNIINMTEQFISVFENSKLTIGENSIVRANQIYFYLNSLGIVEDSCHINVQGILLFQNAYLKMKNNIILRLQTAIMTYNKSILEMGIFTGLTANVWNVMYSTSVSIGDYSTIRLNTLTLDNSAEMKLGKNVTFFVSGKTLDKSCSETKETSFLCQSLLLRGSSKLVIDNVENAKPVFYIQYGDVVQWNTTTIELMNKTLPCIDLFTFKETFEYPNSVDKKEYHLMCDKKLGRYCIGEKQEKVVCSPGYYHCPCGDVKVNNEKPVPNNQNEKNDKKDKKKKDKKGEKKEL